MISATGLGGAGTTCALGFLSRMRRSPRGVLEFLEVVLAHEPEQLFNLPDFRICKRRTTTRFRRLFPFHAFFRFR